MMTTTAMTNNNTSVVHTRIFILCNHYMHLKKNQCNVHTVITATKDISSDKYNKSCDSLQYQSISTTSMRSICTYLPFDVCRFIRSCTCNHARITEAGSQQSCHNKEKDEAISHRDCWRYIHCQIWTAESMQHSAKPSTV